MTKKVLNKDGPRQHEVRVMIMGVSDVYVNTYWRPSESVFHEVIGLTQLFNVSCPPRCKYISFEVIPEKTLGISHKEVLNFVEGQVLPIIKKWLEKDHPIN